MPANLGASGGLSETERGWVKFAQDPKNEAVSGKAKAKKSRFDDARWANRIRKRTPRWLWTGRIYRRAVNILTGDPGVGKSTLVCEIVAAFSTGRQLPGDAEPRDPINCMIMSSEDFADDTIVWRLEHQGANLRRVRIKDTKVELTPECLNELDEKIAEDEIKFVVVDTLTSWMGKEVDLNQTNEVAD
jgi:RecA-family ATPase